jgi:hypothetical protein
MQLGETIATYDVARALRGESGKFDVTSPTGEVYHVNCEPNHSIANLEWAGNRADVQPFLICKVAEPVPLDQARIAAPVTDAARARTPLTPFLLDAESSDEKSSVRGTAESPKSSQAIISVKEIVGPELRFIESDSQTKNPSACVSLKIGWSGQSAQVPMTSACANYQDFDAELRRLHAKLDEIRYLARKQFYKTQAAAMGA